MDPIRKKIIRKKLKDLRLIRNQMKRQLKKKLIAPEAASIALAAKAVQVSVECNRVMQAEKPKIKKVKSGVLISGEFFRPGIFDRSEFVN